MMEVSYAGKHPRDDRRHWPDSLFRVVLVFWLILGLTSILKAMLFARPSVPQVLLVVWGIVVIFVLWFRLGPPREASSEMFR